MGLLNLPIDSLFLITCKLHKKFILLQVSKRMRKVVGHLRFPLGLRCRASFQWREPRAENWKETLRGATRLLTDFDFKIDAVSSWWGNEITFCKVHEYCNCQQASQRDLRELRRLVRSCPSFNVEYDGSYGWQPESERMKFTMISNSHDQNTLVVNLRILEVDDKQRK